MVSLLVSTVLVVGSFVTAILFNIGKFGIGYYIAKSTFASLYGAAGSLLVLLLWTFYSAQSFLFGAEFTKSYSYILGARFAQYESSSSKLFLSGPGGSIDETPQYFEAQKTARDSPA